MEYLWPQSRPRLMPHPNPSPNPDTRPTPASHLMPFKTFTPNSFPDPGPHPHFWLLSSPTSDPYTLT